MKDKNISVLEFPVLQTRSEQGSIYLLTMLTATILLTFAAYAIDAAWGYNQRLKLQASLDVSAMAGARRIGDGAVDDATLKTETIQEIRDIATENGVNLSELPDANILVGQWDSATQVFSQDVTPYNAVSVVGTRTYNTFIANIIGFAQLTVGASSIAVSSGLGAANCLPPFAVDDDVVVNLQPGDSFRLSRASPGNWGKIDLRSDIRGEQDFREAIRDGVCDVEVSVGQDIDTVTGFSGVDNGIDDRFVANSVMVLPIVREFPNGRSSPTQILGFIEVEIVRTDGSGNNWEGDFLVRQGEGGFVGGGRVDEPFIKTRVLVN